MFSIPRGRGGREEGQRRERESRIRYKRIHTQVNSLLLSNNILVVDLDFLHILFLVAGTLHEEVKKQKTIIEAGGRSYLSARPKPVSASNKEIERFGDPKVSWENICNPPSEDQIND